MPILVCLLWLVAVLQPASAAAAGAFVPVGDMTTERWSHTATLLPDGRVLIAGGSSRAGDLSSIEIFDPASGTFAYAGEMSVPRRAHTATLLRDGSVLIAGGMGVATAEIYDPATGSFTRTGDMLSESGGHAAALLPDGRVLIAGGILGSPPWPTGTAAQVFDPSTGTFSRAAEHASPSTLYPDAGAPIWPAVTLLQDGTVLVAGSNPAEVFDPSSGRFRRTGAMASHSYRFGMYWHRATTLRDGRVLITGGNDDWTCGGMSAADIYDPASGRFHALTGMRMARDGHSSTLLENGTVLLSGGGSGWCYTLPLDRAEIFDPATSSFVEAAPMTSRRSFHTATLLADGRVLLAGGMSGYPHGQLRTAEVYTPAKSSPARMRSARP